MTKQEQTNYLNNLNRTLAFAQKVVTTVKTSDDTPECPHCHTEARDQADKDFLDEHGRCLSCDKLAWELQQEGKGENV